MTHTGNVSGWVCDDCKQWTATEDEPCKCDEGSLGWQVPPESSAATIANLRAELARQQPVVDAARKWRELVASAPVSQVQQPLVMDAIDLVRAVDALATSAQDGGGKGEGR